MEQNKITDVVFDINDFIVIANMKQGAIHMGTHGGFTMMISGALKDEKYLLKKFFKSIENVPAINEIKHEIFYEEVPIPPILIDHLFDLSSDDVILTKIRDHLEETSNWLECSGYIAIAEMTFDSSVSAEYRLYNKENMRIIKTLTDQGFRVHLLGNCSKRSLDEIQKVHGTLPVSSIMTSTEIGKLKCWNGASSKIWEIFLDRSEIHPTSVLFVELSHGYIDAVKNFDDRIRTILYQGKEKKVLFLEELSSILDIEIDFDLIKGK
tara:strand:- start:264 stop:1061 length:798 start_codon:yes stop_codon:yes gene_type:complete